MMITDSMNPQQARPEQHQRTVEIPPSYSQDNDLAGVSVLADDCAEDAVHNCRSLLQFCCKSPTAMALCASILTMLIGISLLIVTQIQNDKSLQEGVLLDEQQSREYILFLRELLVLPMGTFLIPGSAMSRALQWMVSEDPLRPLQDEDHLRQRFALATLYYDWSGTRWDLLPHQGWLKSISTKLDEPIFVKDGEVSDAPPATHECDWLGIRCDEQNRVVSLKLEGGETAIAGTISSSIGQLSQLEELELTGHGASLKGRAPSELTNLVNLRVLRLSSNRLSSLDFEGISNLTQLRRLHIEENNLHGTIPSDIQKLVHLEELIFFQNPNLEGQVFSMLLSWPKLRSFASSFTNIGGSLPSQLGQLTDLEDMVGGNSNFVGTIPPSIGNCSKLKVFLMCGVSGFGFEGSIPAEIGKLKELKQLNLCTNTRMKSWLPTEMGQMEKLEELGLSGNEGIAGPLPTELGLLTNLKDISIGVTEISGSIPAELAQLTKLELVDMTSTRLSGIVPDAICDIPTLQEFELSCRGGFALIEPCRCCNCVA